MKSRRSFSVSNNKGMSLIEVTIGLGMMGLLSLVFAQMMANQNKQVQRLESKASLLEVQNLISDTLKDQDICSKQFSDASLDVLKNVGAQTGLVDLTSAGIDLTNPLKEKIPLKKVLLGSTATSAVAIEVGKPIPGTSSLPVSEIYISNFVKKSAANDTQYVADLVAVFDSKVGPIKPLKVQLALATNSDPLTKRAITSCRSAGGSGASGAAAGVVSLEALPIGSMVGACVLEGGINGKTGAMVNPIVTTLVAPATTVMSPWGKLLSCACEPGWRKVQLSNPSSYTAWGGTTTALAAFSCIKE